MPAVADRSCVDRALADAKPSGNTALVDGILAGDDHRESDAGRSLLMVFSDGLDTASFLDTDRVLDMGRRSDVVVYSIASKGARPDFLEELSELTGGRLHEVDRDDDLSKTFRAILDEFRHRYLRHLHAEGRAERRLAQARREREPLGRASESASRLSGRLTTSS